MITSDEKRWKEELGDLEIQIAKLVAERHPELAAGQCWEGADEVRYVLYRKMVRQASWLSNQLDLYARRRQVRRLGEYLV